MGRSPLPNHGLKRRCHFQNHDSHPRSATPLIPRMVTLPPLPQDSTLCLSGMTPLPPSPQDHDPLGPCRSTVLVEVRVMRTPYMRSIEKRWCWITQVPLVTPLWSATFSMISGRMLKTPDIFPNTRISHPLLTHFMERNKQNQGPYSWLMKSSLGPVDVI